MNKSTLIIDVAIKTLSIEIAVLQDLQNSINDHFAQVVSALFGCRGKLVITGIGKSAIIGQKWVATLNSTGSNAVFLHAADAIHGDLGVLRSDDMVICISKSGETPEIKVLVPLIKVFGNPIIAVVSHRTSYLATHADYVLYVPVESEADPNNLAPTASTTAQLALGDAIAVALLSLRGFTPQDFALLHPGGSLGRQLYLRVADLSTHHQAPAVSPQAPLREIIIEMTSKRLGATAVIGPDGELLGIITDGDLRRMLRTTMDLEHITASEIMTHKPKTVHPHEMAVKALEILRKHSITQLAVVDDRNSYQGLIHLHDILKEGII